MNELLTVMWPLKVNLSPRGASGPMVHCSMFITVMYCLIILKVPLFLIYLLNQHPVMSLLILQDLVKNDHRATGVLLQT